MEKSGWSFPLRRETLAGKIIYQPEKGYRYSLEAFLLASFVNLRPREKVLELGSGCGIISLLLAWKYPQNIFWGLEIQAPLLLCFAKNIRENNLLERVLPVGGDVKYPPFKASIFDVVFTNPPYYPFGRGRLSPDSQERLARHEILATLADFFAAASLLLKNKGRFYLICTSSRLAEIFSSLQKVHLEPKTLRFIHSYPGDQGRLFLLEALKGGGKQLKILPPLFVYTKKGGPYTLDIKEMFALL